MKILFKVRIIIVFVLVLLIMYVINSYILIHKPEIQYTITKENIEYLLNAKYSGNNVTVAIIDTGINEEMYNLFTHNNYNLYNATDGSNKVIDTNSHGSWVTCVMKCAENDAITGLIPNARFIIIKVYDEYNRILPEYLVAGIEYALENNADIVNLSLGTQSDYQEIKDIINFVYEEGVLFLALYGDYEETYPAKYNVVLSVGNEMTSEANIIVDDMVYNLNLFQEDAYDYIHEPTTSISCAIATSYIVLLIEKCNEKQIEFDINQIEGMVP